MNFCNARIEQVIITNLTKRGNGTEKNPWRLIQEIWTLDGKKIAEVDPDPQTTGNK